MVEDSLDSRNGRALSFEEISEHDLIALIQEGNSLAFSEFVRRYKQRVFSIVYNVTANAADASDIAQEVFIKVFQTIGSFRGNSSIFTWLYRIAVNMAISHARKNKKHQNLSLNELGESGFEPSQIGNVPAYEGGDRSLFLSELQKNLNEALQKLSNNHRVVFVLYEVEGLSHEEIAKVVGCSVGTVRSRLHYAKQQLQELLKNYL